MNNIWFKRKTYGWGWTPVTWQGWLLVVGYIILVLLLSLAVEGESKREALLFFILPFVLLTITLIRICYKTGKSPRWQWGGDSLKQK